MNIDIKEVISAWEKYLVTVTDWQSLTKNVDAKPSGCGPIYELPNPIDRPHEDFAIADMRDLQATEPHYHEEVEIYFILQGEGLIIVGGKEQKVGKGSVIVMPSNIAHFTIPKKDLVIAVVNTPPFNASHYFPLRESNEAVKFDKDQFDRLTQF
jgi:mannose-6-phosphate isomerase-like protein (cupin superfamily)